MKTYKNCQSCGMPLKKDEKGGGTEKDGSTSSLYCSLCYENGEFKQPDMTAAQMQELVKGKMIEMKAPRIFTGFFTMGIPRLERWKNVNYTDAT